MGDVELFFQESHLRIIVTNDEGSYELLSPVSQNVVHRISEEGALVWFDPTKSVYYLVRFANDDECYQLRSLLIEQQQKQASTAKRCSLLHPPPAPVCTSDASGAWVELTWTASLVRCQFRVEARHVGVLPPGGASAAVSHEAAEGALFHVVYSGAATNCKVPRNRLPASDAAIAQGTDSDLYDFRILAVAAFGRQVSVSPTTRHALPCTPRPPSRSPTEAPTVLPPAVPLEISAATRARLLTAVGAEAEQPDGWDGPQSFSPLPIRPTLSRSPSPLLPSRAPLAPATPPGSGAPPPVSGPSPSSPTPPASDDASDAMTTRSPTSPRSPGSPSCTHTQCTPEPNEIVLLDPESRPVLHEAGWHRLEADAAHSESVAVIGFLGDTRSGKSTLVDLLFPSAASAAPQDVPAPLPPGLQPAVSMLRAQSGAQRYYVIDTHGAATGAPSASPAGACSPIPRLAYLVSDVLVFLSREYFTSQAFFERVRSMSIRATTDVDNAERPALVLISNLCSLEEAEEDVQLSTDRFFETHDPEHQLESFFQEVVCLALPNWQACLLNTDDTVRIKGRDLFRKQVVTLQGIIDGLVNRRLDSRARRGIDYSEWLYLHLLSAVVERFAEPTIRMSSILAEYLTPSNALVTKAFALFNLANGAHQSSHASHAKEAFLRARRGALDMLAALCAEDRRAKAAVIGSVVADSLLFREHAEHDAVQLYEQLGHQITLLTPCEAHFTAMDGQTIYCTQVRCYHGPHRAAQRALLWSGEKAPAVWEGNWLFDDPEDEAALAARFLETLRLLVALCPEQAFAARVDVFHRAVPLSVLHACTPPPGLCLLCLDTCQDPLALPCHHVFCRACIEELRTATADGGVKSPLSGDFVTAGCPLCRQLTSSAVRYSECCWCGLRTAKPAEHRAQCPRRPVACPNSTLCGKIPKADLALHLDECPYRRVQCPHCSRSLQYVDLEDHFWFCPCLDRPCPLAYLGCTARIPNTPGASGAHLAICPHYIVRCPYVVSGCPEAFPRAGLAAHLAVCKHAVGFLPTLPAQAVASGSEPVEHARAHAHLHVHTHAHLHVQTHAHMHPNTQTPPRRVPPPPRDPPPARSPSGSPARSSPAQSPGSRSLPMPPRSARTPQQGGSLPLPRRRSAEHARVRQGHRRHLSIPVPPPPPYPPPVRPDAAAQSAHHRSDSAPLSGTAAMAATPAVTAKRRTLLAKESTPTPRIQATHTRRHTHHGDPMAEPRQSNDGKAQVQGLEPIASIPESPDFRSFRGRDGSFVTLVLPQAEYAQMKRFLSKSQKRRELVERDDWEIDFKELRIGDSPLARGAFGSVYRGTWCGTEVAVKILHNEHAMSPMLRQEIAILRHLRHPNVVLFMGVAPSPACIVTEFLSGGSLWDILHNPKAALPPGRIVHLALDIARGMQYLHRRGVLHRDLKSPNVLIDKHWQAKVGDFGLSSLPASEPSAERPRSSEGHKRDSPSMPHTRREPARPAATHDNGGRGEPTLFSRAEAPLDRRKPEAQQAPQQQQAGWKGRRVGTVHWTAPEILRGGDFTERSDVYSFGIVLWEFFSRRLPFGQQYARDQDALGRALAESSGTLRPELQDTWPQRFVVLIKECWAEDPEVRPLFDAVVQRLLVFQRTLPTSGWWPDT